MHYFHSCIILSWYSSVIDYSIVLIVPYSAPHPVVIGVVCPLWLLFMVSFPCRNVSRQRMCRSTLGSEWVGGQVSGWMRKWVGGQVGGWVGKWVGGWASGWVGS